MSFGSLIKPSPRVSDMKLNRAFIATVHCRYSSSLSMMMMMNLSSTLMLFSIQGNGMINSKVELRFIARSIKI